MSFFLFAEKYSSEWVWGCTDYAAIETSEPWELKSLLLFLSMALVAFPLFSTFSNPPPYICRGERQMNKVFNIEVGEILILVVAGMLFRMCRHHPSTRGGGRRNSE